jgi:hypothetical protein
MILLLTLAFSSCQKTPRKPAAEPKADPGAGAAAVAATRQQQGPQTAQGAPAVSAPQAAVAPAPAAQRPVAAQPQQGARPITLAPDIPGQGQAPPPRALASISTLMALDRDRRTLPEDFKIGPLGDERGGSVEEQAAIGAADKFLSHLVKGTVDKSLIAPESQASLTDMLTYGLQQGTTPAAFRLGTAKTRDDGEITATVRLFGPDGTAEGEIYMEKPKTQWLVTDLQLSLAQMAVKREKPKEKFFPSAYRWLLEE